MKPVHSLRLRGHLMGVVDKEQWSAGEASAIAEVALAKMPVKILQFTRDGAIPQHPFLTAAGYYE